MRVERVVLAQALVALLGLGCSSGTSSTPPGPRDAAEARDAEASTVDGVVDRLTTDQAGVDGERDVASDGGDTATDASVDHAVEAPSDGSEGGADVGDAAADRVDAATSLVWAAVVLPDPSAVHLWALGRGDLLISGSMGLQRWNGSQWTAFSPQPPFEGEVRGSGDDDVWIFAASTGALAHWDGVSWKDVSLGTTQGQVGAFWNAGSSEAWVAVSTELPPDSNQTLHRQGALYHFKDGAWAKASSPLDAHLDAVTGVMWGASASDVWATDKPLMHWDGAVWTEIAPPLLTEVGVIVESMWGSSSDDLWLGGETSQAETLWHFDGTAWTEFDAPETAARQYGAFVAVWGSGPADWWALGKGELWHFDGKTWTPGPASTTGWAFGANLPLHFGAPSSGTAPDDAWALATSEDRGNGCPTGPNGRCEADMRTLAHSSDPAEISRQLTDPTTTLGALAQVAHSYGMSACMEAALTSCP